VTDLLELHLIVLRHDVRTSRQIGNVTGMPTITVTMLIDRLERPDRWVADPTRPIAARPFPRDYGATETCRRSSSAASLSPLLLAQGHKLECAGHQYRN
jgi:hypothetical protein